MTKAEILTWINDQLGENYSSGNIEAEILEVLNDLTVGNNFLVQEDNCASVVGQHAYDETSFGISNFKGLKSIKIDDGLPLESITWERYQYLIENETSSNYGEPEKYYFDEINKKAYLYPAPDVITYTIYLTYFAFDNDIDDILLGNEFKYLVFKGTAYQVLVGNGKGETNRAKSWKAWYEEKKSSMVISKSGATGNFTQYRDLG